MILKKLKNLNHSNTDTKAFEKKISEFPVWLWEAVGVFHAQQFYDPKILHYFNNEEYPQISQMNVISKNNKIYSCGYTIIEYILFKYGRNQLIILIESYGDLNKAFQVSDEDFSRDWYDFVNDKYLKDEPGKFERD